MKHLFSVCSTKADTNWNYNRIHNIVVIATVEEEGEASPEYITIAI